MLCVKNGNWAFSHFILVKLNSMQLKKKSGSVIKKSLFYTPSKGYFFINFLFRNWLLKKKQERVHAFYINHCTFPFSLLQKCFAFESKPIETNNCKIKYHFFVIFT